MQMMHVAFPRANASRPIRCEARVADETPARPFGFSGHLAREHEEIRLGGLHLAPSRLHQVRFAVKLETTIDLLAHQAERPSRRQLVRFEDAIQEGLEGEAALLGR